LIELTILICYYQFISQNINNFQNITALSLSHITTPSKQSIVLNDYIFGSTIYMGAKNETNFFF